MKLSKTQEAILRRMGEGDALLTIWPSVEPYPTGYRWDSEPDMATRIQGPSLAVLLGKGLITGPEYWPEKWSITPAGRAYLEGLE